LSTMMETDCVKCIGIWAGAYGRHKLMKFFMTLPENSFIILSIMGVLSRRGIALPCFKEEDSLRLKIPK